MDSYKIEWKRSAIKELKKLPKETMSKILVAARKFIVKSASKSNNQTCRLTTEF